MARIDHINALTEDNFLIALNHGVFKLVENKEWNQVACQITDDHVLLFHSELSFIEHIKQFKKKFSYTDVARQLCEAYRHGMEINSLREYAEVCLKILRPFYYYYTYLPDVKGK